MGNPGINECLTNHCDLFSTLPCNFVKQIKNKQKMETLSIAIFSISLTVNLGILIYSILPKHDENSYTILPSNLTSR